MEKFIKDSCDVEEAILKLYDIIKEFQNVWFSLDTKTDVINNLIKSSTLCSLIGNNTIKNREIVYQKSKISEYITVSNNLEKITDKDAILKELMKRLYILEKTDRKCLNNSFLVPKHKSVSMDTKNNLDQLSRTGKKYVDCIENYCKTYSGLLKL